MNDAPIHIRNPAVTRAIRELAAKKGQPISKVVADVVHAELARMEEAREAEVQRRLARAAEVVAEFNALPTLGTPLTDDDIYDEDGLPR